MKDIDPKQFPLHKGDKVLIIKTDYGSNVNPPEEITITQAVNVNEGYYEGENKKGEIVRGLARFQLKKK